MVVLAVVSAAGALAQTATAAVPGDFFNSPTILGSAACGTVTGSNVGATREPGEPLHAGNIGGASVWYVWKAPASGAFSFDTFGSNFDTLLAVYTGSSVNLLKPVGFDDDFGGSRQSRVGFTATAGTFYSIAVDGFNPGTKPATGTVVLHWSGASNDAFDCAAPLTGACGRTSGSTVGATAELGEPFHAGKAPLVSVWYRWTAPESGPVGIDTTGSTVDTRLAVYTGPLVTKLSTVASNDNADATIHARVAFQALAGTTYQIAVDTNGKTGPIQLHWALAGHNDPFDCAEILGGSFGVVTGSNVGATMEAGEPEDGGVPGAASTWYDWTAPTSSWYEFDTVGSAPPLGGCMDTLLSVWTGGTLGTLTRTTWNDDVGLVTPACPLASRVDFFATAGVTYRLEFDVFAPPNGEGNTRLNWQSEASGPNTVPSGAGVNAPAAGSVRVGDVQRFVTTCTDVRGWHDLRTLDFSLRRGRGAGAGEPEPLHLQFDEKAGLMRLYDPQTGSWREGVPGSNGLLSTRYADLRLAGSSIVGSGPTGPTVTLTWEVVFKPPAAGRSWQQYLQTVDDFGGTLGLQKVGSFSILR